MGKKTDQTLVVLFMVFALAITPMGCGSSGGSNTNGGGDDVNPVVTVDTVPDVFNFTEQLDAPVKAVFTSNEITVAGINAPADISIAGNEAEYSINDSDYSRDAGTVKNNDRVAVRMASSPEYHTEVTATLTIGGISASFTVKTQKEWAVVSAGGVHTLGVKIDGTLWGWGGNGYSQNGNGSTTQENKPKQIGVAKDWCFVSAGASYSMALKTDGSLWGWGLNDLGQIGNGTSGTNVSIPARIGADKTWASVDTGSRHTLGVTTDGKLYVWGYNVSGQLGDGTTEDKHNPTQIGEAISWAKVSAGYDFSVGITTDGALYTWGNNDMCQLGLGTKGGVATKPNAVIPGTTWVSASAGSRSSIAINTDGHIYAWGDNTEHRLGDGSIIFLSPTRVGGDLSLVSISTSGQHTLSIDQEGLLYTWGWNRFGQIGDGTQENKSFPTLIMPGKKWSFVSVAADGTFSLAIDDEGSLWAWGYNTQGQLGITSKPEEPYLNLTPVRVVCD